MRAILDSTFSINVAAGAEKLLKKWQKGSAEYDLGEEKAFDCLMLQENIRNGQRVEEFSLEVNIDGTCREICRGTTIGYKRLMRFEPVTARFVRLKILKSRGPAEISGFGLYRSPGEK